MARLSDVYKTKNNREIVLDAFQANVFEATIEKFKADGVGGDDIFEETYVLQKEIAEYITGNIAAGSGGIGGLATQTYNYILGIEAVAPTAPPVVVEPTPVAPDPIVQEVAPDLPPIDVAPAPLPVSPVKPDRPYRPLKPFKPVRPFKPAVNVNPRPIPRPNPYIRNIFGGFGNFNNFGESPAGSIANSIRNRGNTSVLNRSGRTGRSLFRNAFRKS
jgi:hypothetical protein